MKITRMFSLVFVLVVAVAAAACSSGSPSPTATPVPGAADPVTAVKDFFTAAYGGQDTSAYTCSSNSAAAETFQVAAAASRASGSSVDTSGLTFTVKTQTADKATVTVGGELSYSLLTSQTTATFPTTDVSVVNEGGTWKFCGGAS
ncbi:MAG TPA: hypothetical protein VHD90_10810 [Phototrophicaceae bacterium]|nr:hypothetical protein [Phototrophicaceae bacterium]